MAIKPTFSLFPVQVRNSTTSVAREPMSLREAVPCNEKSTEPRRTQRGDYWVLYNYVPMSMAVKCWESVTYTTHADYTFLDNLEPLLERWRAPISIAMHAPGTDFPATLDAIRYSRNCGSSLISQLVTFHVFFSSKHVPKVVNTRLDGRKLSLEPPRRVPESLSNSGYTASSRHLANVLTQYDERAFLLTTSACAPNAPRVYQILPESCIVLNLIILQVLSMLI